MQITVDIPQPLSGQSSTDLAARARLLVVDEVRAERLTRSAGAHALGMTLDEFLIEAGTHGLFAVRLRHRRLQARARGHRTGPRVIERAACRGRRS